jgi:membrane associated rhomboid family serine protease
VQAPIGSLCPECRREGRPDTRTRLRWWNARQPTLITYALIAVNIGFYIWTVIADQTPIAGPGTWGRGTWDLALAKPFLELDNQWFRLVSSGFLHFSILHIAMNMLLLFQLGQMLEPVMGRLRFAMIYFAAMLAGSAGVLLVSPDSLTGGASGAVFGLMAAAVVALHQRGVNPFQTGLGATFVINILLTFTIEGISIGGHIGGAIGGAVCAVVMLAPRDMRVPQWATYVVPVVVAAASVGVAIAVAG